MHKMQLHRVVPMINGVFARSTEMKLFEQVEIIIEHDCAVLIKREWRLRMLWVPRLDHFRKRFNFLQRMPVLTKGKGASQ